jgi:hypothetical protein
MRLDDLMKRLGYSDSWLDAGVVTEASVRSQYVAFETSDDKNPEHYRDRAFHEFLENCTRLSDFQLDQILALRDDGPDNCDLRANRLIALISSVVLTDTQLDALSRLPEVHEPPVSKRYIRACVLRSLAREGIIDRVVSAIVDSQDAVLHEALLSHPEVARAHLEWLSRSGHNKSVRNRALRRLRGRV